MVIIHRKILPNLAKMHTWNTNLNWHSKKTINFGGKLEFHPVFHFSWALPLLRHIFSLVWIRCIMHFVYLWWDPTFKSTGSDVRVKKGEVCYRQTRLGTPEFQSIGSDMGVGKGKVCYGQTWPDFSPVASLTSPFPTPKNLYHRHKDLLN